MSQNYQRHQIILTEVSPEFTVYGKRAFGKCILEAKGELAKVVFSVQNLKPGTVCNAYIVAADKGESLAVNIGKVIANASGVAELKWSCSSRDVDDSGLPLKTFNVAGIMVPEGNTMRAPIVGYRDGETMWKNDIRIHSKRPPNTSPPPVQPANDDTSQNAEIEEVEVSPIIHEEGSPTIVQAEIPNFIENFTIPNLPDYPPVEPEEFFETMEESSAERALKDVANKINEKLNEIDSLAFETPPEAEKPPENPILATHELQYLQNIFESCSKIRPFKKQDDNEEWVRITPNELNFLPSQFENLHNDHLVINAYRKFNHLVLGRKKQGEYVDIAFGIPDIYAARGEETVKAAGFMGFQNCDSEEAHEGTHGYWLRIVKYGGVNV